MQPYRPDDPAIMAAATRWGQISAELRLLEGKTDPASRERYEALLEELMCVDMDLGPIKKAMAQAADDKRRKERSEQPPTETPKDE